VAGSARFVGRQGELARFRQALSGDARLILAVGDAGVGKTRFVTQASAAAAADGVVAVWGHCLPLADKLPLLPVTQALRGLSRHAGIQLPEVLAAVPAYARAELARLVPALAADTGGLARPARESEAADWLRDRMFSALAEVLAEVAARSPLVLVVEDVHWADSGTLDCLTYLLAMPGEPAVTVVATCRADEAPLDAHVLAWLGHVRGRGPVTEIRLSPLSRAEAAEQVAVLADGPVPSGLADAVYARAEGRPFFTEQLVMAALAADGSDGASAGPDGLAALPARLAELLLARAARCGPDGQPVLAALAVAARPLDETALEQVTGHDLAAVRRGLRELAAARLLADPGAGPAGASRPRHALLAEAVAGALLPGERLTLHERTASMLDAAGDETLTAEAAGHFQRAIELCRDLEQTENPAAATAAAGTDRPGLDLPGLYVQAVDALDNAGNSDRAAAVTEEAYSRFAGHPDPATAATAIMRAAQFRQRSQPEVGLALLKEAVRVVGGGPASAVLAEAWYRYGFVHQETGAGSERESRAALERAAEIAAQAGALALVPRSLVALAVYEVPYGDVDHGLALLGRARDLAGACGDGESLLSAASLEASIYYITGRLEAALEAGLAGLRVARRLGLQDSLLGAQLASGACADLLYAGRVAEAEALISPLTSGAPDIQHVYAHLARVEADMVRGESAAAWERLRQVQAVTADQVGGFRGEDTAPHLAAELALWSGRPGEALSEVSRELPLLSLPIMYEAQPLLALGLRACADLAETARAGRDEAGEADALAAAADLVSWVDRLAVRPFVDLPGQWYPSAVRASWEAERTRLAGHSDPAAWATAAKAWADMSHPHQAGYAWWRQAEALLAEGHPTAVATPPLRAAAAAARGHVPLLAQVRTLAVRARVVLDEAPAEAAAAIRPALAVTRQRLGLTGRELAVLRLLARGQTNAQIGRELYMSPKTASVHVSSIYRKLGVSGRAQAGAAAERAGLLGGDS
jgi:DNA-binding CsgD family transcriptional regulator/tetratricopeptide (TPR) repeat protein